MKKGHVIYTLALIGAVLLTATLYPLGLITMVEGMLFGMIGMAFIIDEL